MLWKGLFIAFPIAAAALLVGCASWKVSSVDALLSRPPAPACADLNLYRREGNTWHTDIAAFTATEKKRDRSLAEALDDFLDCTVAPVPPGSTELKLYRGYVVLALLSRYAAFNYTGLIENDANLHFRAYPELHDDAVLELSRIETAGRSLRAASSLPGVRDGALAESDASSLSVLVTNRDVADAVPTVVKVHRALAVLLVATGAERPTARRAEGWFTRVLRAISGNPVAISTDTVDDGLKVIGKSLTLTVFGDAYLRDARARIEAFGNGTPTVKDWHTWSVLIADACGRLSVITGVANHCAEGWPRTVTAADTIH